MAHFDWHTDDENWPDEETDLRRARSSRRRWPALLLALLVLAGGGYWLVGMLQQQAETAVANVRAEVEASFGVIQTAAARGDIELLTLHLSGRDPGWAAGQRRLLGDGHLFDYADFGLQPAGDGETVADVLVSPGLLAAELVAEREYAIVSPNGRPTIVRLRRSYVFRRGEAGRWLWSPPDAEFWGDETYSGDGRHFTLACPERDADFCGFLNIHLDHSLDILCDDAPGFTCPGSKVIIRFSPDPATLQAVEPTALFRRGAYLYLKLPTPSLIGLPVDQTSREALFHRYAAFIIGHAVTRLSDYDCCRQGLFFQAAVDKQLWLAGVQDWPLTAVDYARVLETRPRLHDFHTEWRFAGPARGPVDSDAQRQVYALIDFLTEKTAVSPVALSRSLGGTTNYWGWLNQFTTADADGGEQLEAAWRRYLVTKAGRAASSIIE